MRLRRHLSILRCRVPARKISAISRLRLQFNAGRNNRTSRAAAIHRYHSRRPAVVLGWRWPQGSHDRFFLLLPSFVSSLAHHVRAVETVVAVVLIVVVAVVVWDHHSSLHMDHVFRCLPEWDPHRDTHANTRSYNPMSIRQHSRGRRLSTRPRTRRSIHTAILATTLQSTRPPLDLPYELAPNSPLIPSQSFEISSDLLARASPNTSVPAYRALHVSTAKDALEGDALSESGHGADEGVHLFETD